ncbi:TPA: hypothetical protein DDZ01_01150 [Candidatus Uhrbacteria bacterium]|nr:hypothetical protein [Candidatus Uhrbacteria bacterium]HCB55374.1 hypothetical protein [Candidatus Uhrbacteria bacterium]
MPLPVLFQFKRSHMQQHFPPDLNPHILGIVMREVVRRAMLVIFAQRFTHTIEAKLDYNGNPGDLRSSADIDAQAMYAKILRETFPQIGIVAEEHDLSIPCTHPTHDLYFTVDPLDGTKAYARRESQGIATMISLVCNEVVIASCIGNPLTGEVFYTRPQSKYVHLLQNNLPVTLPLRGFPVVVLTERYAVIRDRPEKYSLFVQTLLRDPEHEGLFKNYNIESGSIGIMFSRLWTNVFGATILKPGWQTPWDLSPLIVISRRMGFVFMHICPEEKTFELFDPTAKKEKYFEPCETMVIHHTNLSDLSAFTVTDTRT